jgi:hypothetical protein
LEKEVFYYEEPGLTDDTTTQCVLFPELADKPVAVQFDEEQGSSNGGAVLLKAADRRLSLTDRLASCLEERRDSGRVRHSIWDMLAQRTFGIACGYADCNDAARIGEDPIHKLLLDRDPLDGERLASQPTLSRFENAVTPRELYRMGVALAEAVIERHGRRLKGRARKITIDLDPTDDPTHGAQQLSLFNGHYDCWCYLPVMGFLTFDDEADQYLVAAVLRPGNAPAKVGALGILERLLTRLRQAFPKAQFLVRLDGGFACPELFSFLEAQAGVKYVVAMGKNSVLERKAKKLMREARQLSKKSGKTEHVFGDTEYSARKWKMTERRVVIKAEVVRHPGRPPKENPRFVVTNLKQSPRWIYRQVYCGRGDIENRIKELHYGLEIDRTSCSGFWANQLRVLMTAAAYVLMQEIRLRARRTRFARAQVGTLRLELLKLGARVVRSVRRIVIHLPRPCSASTEWRRIALSLGAVAG